VAVTASWFSIQTFGSLVAAVVFAALCLTSWRRALVVFTAAGAVRGVEIGAFSGEEMTQGLLPIELLATILIAAWCLKGGLVPDRIRRTAFNLPLLLLIPCSIVSLVVGFTFYDPSIPLNHMKLSVSLGQILLLVWPIGIYLTVAGSIEDLDTVDTLRRTIVLLAIPSLLLLVTLRAWPYVEWSTTFALPASSLCFAEFFRARGVLRRAALLLISVAPAVYGYEMGKAFFYAYVLVSMPTIGWLCAPRFALAFATPAMAAYILLVPVATGSLEPGFLKEAVDVEQGQASLGGSSGRDALVKDSMGVWLRHPLFGVGPGNNYPYMLRYSTIGTAHNQFMNILMELGVFGLVCFGWFAWGAVETGLSAWRVASSDVTRTVVAGWFGLFAAMLVGGFFGDFMIPSIRNGGLGLLALFYVQWILLGMVVSIRSLERARLGAPA
jgi:hypothetical protein